MKVEFEYYGETVSLSDEGEVKCRDPERRFMWETQLALGGLNKSMAFEVANDLKNSGYIEHFRVIKDKTEKEY